MGEPSVLRLAYDTVDSPSAAPLSARGELFFVHSDFHLWQAKEFRWPDDETDMVLSFLDVPLDALPNQPLFS
jgi:hypothetical protein